MTRGHAQQALREELSAPPSVGTVLASLAMAKCVASNSAPGELELALTVNGLKDNFAPYIFSSVLVERGRPEPDLSLFMLRSSLACPQSAAASSMTALRVSPPPALTALALLALLGLSTAMTIMQAAFLSEVPPRVQDWDQFPSLLAQLGAHACA